MGTIAKVTAGGATHLIASTAYATCPTGAGTAAKIATIQDSQAFTLIDGVTVHVYFTYSNTVANPTLNVNSTGAKAIYKFGSTAAGTTEVDSWPAGSVVSFTYNKNGASGGCWTINNFQKQTAQVNSDWTATTGTSSILNKPTIPAAQVNSNWTATTGVTSILNKPSIPSTYSDVGAASAGHTHTAADIGAVPTTRTVNGKSLNANITLTAADVGALPTTTVIPAAQVNSNWTATTGVSSILNKPAIPSTYSDVGAMSASGVSVNRKVSTGINIADITINGTATSLYAPQAGESPIYSYTLDYGAAVDSAAVLSAYNAGGIILVKDNIAPDFPIGTLQRFEGNSSAISGLTFVTFTESTETRYYWDPDPLAANNGWSEYTVYHNGLRVFDYGSTYASSTLLDAYNNGECLVCRVGSSFVGGTAEELLPLISMDQDENIFDFGGVRFNGSQYIVEWARWEDGWDDFGSYTIPASSNPTTWYGTCGTTASTTAKAVTISGFTSSDFKTGTIIGIMFTTGNTAATPTLNINSLGAKSISIAGTAISSTTNVLKWSANTMIYFMYDGTYFRYMYANAAASTTQPRGANTWYGTSSTAATTQAKTSTIDNFVLTKGAIAVINFSTANTYSSAKITLNINSTGAKDVYYKNAVTSTTNKPLWKANSCVTFVYSGSYYHIVNITPSPNDEIYDCGQVEFNTQDQDLRKVVGIDPSDLNDTTDIGSALASVWYAADHVQHVIQVTGTENAISASTSGSMYFASMSSVVYQPPFASVVYSDSTGGVRVSKEGYYKVTASLYVNATSAMIGPSNYRHGLYIFVGTASATSSCTEAISYVQLSAGNYAINVGPGIVHANAGDKIYLVYRPLGMTASFSPANKASYLLVEEMP